MDFQFQSNYHIFSAEQNETIYFFHYPFDFRFYYNRMQRIY